MCNGNDILLLLLILLINVCVCVCINDDIIIINVY